ncbi:MAG: serine hydrolase [Planctomycetaceae bacterium]
MRARSISLAVVVLALASRLALAADWSEEQISKLPSGETPVRLFNGKDLTGWEGHTGKYFNVEDGMIVGKNAQDNAPKASTYLLTKQKYKNFRLIFESRLVTSEMHSGIALWGKAIEKEEGPFTYQGHLVMYPFPYGYFDLYRRNYVYQDPMTVGVFAGKQHEWNRMEILAIGNRIRHVVNGQLIGDWSDPQPQLCELGPIGLQLHSNVVPQEVQWRGLILTENPQDRLITAVSRNFALKAEGSPPAESGFDPEALKRIDERMVEFARAKQIAGAVTLVARHGRVVHLSATGKADVAQNRDMAKDTVFAIASMTKPITAVALMILQDEGKLKLDDPVSKYIPTFKQTKVKGGAAPAREITIRDCLTHTNGLESDQKNTGTLAETAEQLAKSELKFSPGTEWLYGPGLSVAGRVVEVVSGKPFEEFLAERVFYPLQMKETSFHPTLEQRHRLARVYQPTADGADLEQGTHWLFESMSPGTPPNPSGGLYSTAGDLVRFYQMILNGGELNGKRILSADAVNQMTTLQNPEVNGGIVPGAGRGLGFALIREPQAGMQALSAGSYGHGGAFGTQAWVDPARDTIVIFLVARQNFKNGLDLFGELPKLTVAATKD